MPSYVRSAREDRHICFPGGQVLSDDKKCSPMMNHQLCFLIQVQIVEIPFWSWQMVDSVLAYSALTFVFFLCFHWHFNGKLKESINRMANLMLSGPTTLSTIFSKIKTEALVNWSGFSHWIGSQWISSGNFNTMQLLDAYQIITINLNYSFYFYKDVPPEWWS